MPTTDTPDLVATVCERLRDEYPAREIARWNAATLVGGPASSGAGWTEGLVDALEQHLCGCSTAADISRATRDWQWASELADNVVRDEPWLLARYAADLDLPPESDAEDDTTDDVTAALSNFAASALRWLGRAALAVAREIKTA